MKDYMVSIVRKDEWHINNLKAKDSEEAQRKADMILEALEDLNTLIIENITITPDEGDTDETFCVNEDGGDWEVDIYGS